MIILCITCVALIPFGCSDNKDIGCFSEDTWGRKRTDFVGVWKALGKNYGKDYESIIVDVTTIKKLKLELLADGSFLAANWPAENWDTKEVRILPVYKGTWRYTYLERERYALISLRAFPVPTFGSCEEQLLWTPLRRGKTLDMSRNFARYLYLENDGTP